MRDTIIRLRPHHILCIHAFRGMGYSDSFVLNMTRIKEEVMSGTPFKIVFSDDDICLECPNLLNSRKCKSEENVLRIDRNVISTLSLVEREYSYNEIRELVLSLTEESHRFICSSCSWFRSGKCFEQISKILTE